MTKDELLYSLNPAKYNKTNTNDEALHRLNPVNYKSSYQKNLAQPVQTTEAPSIRGTIAKIMQITSEDPERGYNLQRDFNYLQTQRNSIYYDPFTVATNPAIAALKSYGVDTSDENWYENYSHLKNYYVSSGTTNNATKPNKNAPYEQQVAYWYSLADAERGTTEKAEQEIAALQEEISFYTNWQDRNYSDEYIANMFNFKTNKDLEKKYPTVAKMISTASSGEPMKLNKALPLANEDWVQAQIWAARNGGGTGNIYADMANSYLGVGNVYKEDPVKTAKLNMNGDTASPYELGATGIDDVLKYFNLYSIDEKTLENIRSTIDWEDKTARDMFGKAGVAVSNKIELDKEEDAIYKDIDNLIKNTSSDPDDIISTIKANPDYKMLFALDETLNTKNYEKYGELIPVSGAVGYRWDKVEQYIRDECAKKEAKDNVGDAVNSTAISITNPPTPAPKGYVTAPQNTEIPSASEIAATPSPSVGSTGSNVNVATPTPSMATPTPAPVISESDIAIDDAARKILTDLEPVIASAGTDSEKLAMKTGKTSIYEKSMEALQSVFGNFQEVIGNKIIEQVNSNYVNASRGIIDYTNHQDSLNAANSRLEETEAEWKYYDDREKYNQENIGLTSEQLTNLLNVANGTDNWDYYRKRLENVNNPNKYVDEYQTELDDQALRYLVEKTYGFESAIGNDIEWIREEGKRLWDVYQNETTKPAGRTKNYVGEAKFTLGERTAPLTAEERERYNILTDLRSEQEEIAQREYEWLAAHQGEYNDYLRDKNSLSQIIGFAASTNANVDNNIIGQIDYALSLAQNDVSVQQIPYSVYDYNVANGYMSKQEALQQASATADQDNQALDAIKGVLSYLQSNNVQLSDEEMKRLNTLVSELEWESYGAATVALDASDDFDKMVTKGKEEAADDTGNAKLLTYFGENVGDPDSSEYSSLFNKLITSNAITGDNSLDWYHILRDITQDEVNRYFYLYGKDGKEAADKYMDYLIDGEHGMMTMRSTLKDQEYLEEYGSRGPLEAIGSWIGAEIMKPVGTASGIVYRALGGKNPYAPAASVGDNAQAALSGVKSFITSTFGEGSTASKIAEKIVDVGTGLADIGISSAIFGGFSKFFEGTKIGRLLSIKTVKDIGSVAQVSANAAQQAWGSVLKQTGDIDKANQMSAVTFLSDLISHTIVMKGIGKAMATQPNVFASKMAQIGKTALQNIGMSVGSSVFTENFMANMQKNILKEASPWGQAKQKYLDMDYSESMAEEAADKEIGEKVWGAIVESGVNALVRTALVIGAKEIGAQTKNFIEGIKDKLQVADSYYNPQPGMFEDPVVYQENGTPYEAEWASRYEPGTVRWYKSDNGEYATVKDSQTQKEHVIVGYRYSEDNGETYLIDENGWELPTSRVDKNSLIESLTSNEGGATYGLVNDIYKNYQRNSGVYARQEVPEEAPDFTESNVSGTGETGLTIYNLRPGYPNGDAAIQQMQKDTSLLMSTYEGGQPPTSVVISSVLNDGNPAAAIAAGQAIVGDLAGGDTKFAAQATNSLLLAGLSKNDMNYAALTNGAGRQALEQALANMKTGLAITEDDVNAIRDGLASDRASGPRKFENSFKAAIKDSMVANKVLEVMRQNGSNKKATAARKATKDKKANLEITQKKADEANNKVATIGENLKQVESEYDPSVPATAAPLEQTTNQLLGATEAAKQAEENVTIAQQKAEEAQQEEQTVNNDILAEARPLATDIVNQQEAEIAETSYNNAVVLAPPTQPFGHSIEVFDSEGRPVQITGVYDVREVGNDYVRDVLRNSVGEVHTESTNFGQPTQIVMYNTLDGGLAMETLGRQDADGNVIREYGDVDTEGNDEVINATYRLYGNNRNGSDIRHPAIAPAVYFPSSFPINANGQKVHMIGLVGKEDLGDAYSPVIMGMDGKNYSVDDPGFDDQLSALPSGYADALFDAFYANEETLATIPAEQITRIGEGNNVREEEPFQDTEAPVPGTVGEGDNEGQLPSTSGRDVGLGDNGDVGSDGGEGVYGRDSEGVPTANGQDLRGVHERLLTKQQRAKLGRKKVTSVALTVVSDPQVFSANLDANRESSPYKLFVDPQSPEELEEKGAIMLSSKDGKIVGAVGTKGIYDGDIFGVCKNLDSKAKNASKNIIISAIAQGGNKLDCYNGTERNPGLPMMYSSVGMIPVARVAFNPAFHEDDGWDYERDGEPDVIFWMLNPGETADSVIDKYGKTEEKGGFHLYTMEELAKLPLFEDTVDENGEVSEWGYDKAWAYRDKLLKIGKTNPTKLELMMGEAESETFNALRNKLLSGEPLTEDDVNALYETPQVQYALTNRMEGSSIDPSLVKGFGFENKDDIAKIESQLPAEQVEEQHRIKEALDSQGSAVIDENGKVSYTGEVEQGKRLDLILGLAASGKSTIADRISARYKSRFLDADQAKELHPLYMDGLNEDHIHLESKFINDQRTIEAAERGDNIIAQVLGENPASVAKRIQFFKDNGYEVHLHMTDLNKNKALGRALSRYLKTARYHDIRHLMKAEPEKINETFDLLKGDEAVDGYTKWSTDVPRSELPVLLDASDDDEANLFGGIGSDLQRGTALQGSQQEGRSGNGNDASSGNDNGSGSGGLNKEQNSGIPFTRVPVNNEPFNAPSQTREGVSIPNGPLRQFNAKTAQESNALHESVKAHLLENSVYEPDSNMEQIDRAITWIESHATEKDPTGFWSALNEVTSEDFNSLSVDGQARILTLASMAAQNGLVDAETRLYDLFGETGTDIGQSMQVRKIFRLMTPVGRKTALENEAKKIEAEYRARGKKGLKLNVSPETMEMAANAKTAEEFEQARKKMERELAEQIPSDWRLKMRTIRMAAMLANPRTHIRNLEGNFIFRFPLAIKNAIGTALEKGMKVPVGERTKSMERPDELVNYATNLAQEMKELLQGTAKYYDVSAVEANRKAFGTKNNIISKTLGKFIQWGADKNSDLLEKEDWLSLNKHFINAIVSYMASNGYTEADMKGEVREKGIAYAVNEAQKATYRDLNKAATWLNDQSNKPAWIQFGVNAVLPFVKTPMNIVRRGAEYSPLGLAYTLASKKHALELYKDWEESGFKGKKPKGAKSPSEVIDSLSAGLTGTAFAGIGALLAALGLLKVTPTEGEKRKGVQEYSINLFGKSFSISNMVPSALPLLLGGSIYEEISELKKGDTDVWGVLQAIGNMFQPTIETTMFMSLNSMLESPKYSTDTTASAFVQKLLANYTSSFVPSIVGAVAKTIDTTRRKSYTMSGDKGAVWNQLAEQVQNKIPFLSKYNVPYLNEWGEEEVNSPVMALLENFILPDKITDVKESQLDDILDNLTTSTGINVNPDTKAKTLSINGKSEKLTDKQWYQYHSTRNQLAKERLQELIERPEFFTLEDKEAQVALIKEVYSFANAKAALDLFPDRNINSTVAEELEADKKGELIDYIFNKEEEKAKSAAVTQHKKALNISIEQNDMEAAMTDIDILRMAGVEDSAIKSSITKYFKPLYKEAYDNGDYEEMLRIQALLKSLHIGYESYSSKDWAKWQ